MNRLLIALLLTAFNTSAIAYSDYRCSIKRIVTAQLSPNNTLKLYETLIGKTFTVERSSGIMAGALKNSYLTMPQIIDRGSKDNSFKAVTTLRREESAGAGTNIYTLVINEYESSEQKSFLFSQNDMAFFGTCESY